ncbi:Cytosine deaminase [Mycobacteroides abscessus subsp. abscessus]|nr:Cytosine deaminase [Mycobacteroides abscessus subsp. abscessus]
MLQVLLMGLHATQLTGYEEIMSAMDLITINSAKTLHIEERYGIEEGKPADFIVLPTENEYEAIRRQVPVRYSYRHGEKIAETKLSETRTLIDGFEDPVQFSR